MSHPANGEPIYAPVQSWEQPTVSLYKSYAPKYPRPSRIRNDYPDTSYNWAEQLRDWGFVTDDNDPNSPDPWVNPATQNETPPF